MIPYKVLYSNGKGIWLKISKLVLINKQQQRQNNHKNKEKQTCIYKKIASAELLPIYENVCNICSLNLVKTHW